MGDFVVTRSDEGSLALLYADERDRLLRLAAFVTGDTGTAAEIVQDAFVDLHAVWESVDTPAAWLRGAVTKRSVSWMRRQIVARRYLHVGLRVDREVGFDLPDRVAVRAAVADLSPQQRAAVFCRYYLDLSEAETAQALGVRPGTVKSRLSRALRALEEALDDA